MASIVLVALIVIVIIKVLLIISGLDTKMSKKLKIYTLITCILAILAIVIIYLNFELILNGFFEFLGIIIGILAEGIDLYIYDKYSISKEDNKK